MKKLIAALFFCSFLVLTSQQSFAQQSGFGIGAMLNSPTGISMKGWVSPNVAIDAGISFDVGQNFSQFYLHSNLLRHSAAQNEELGIDIKYGVFRYYYGIGARMLWSDVGNNVTAGLRTPLGSTFAFGDSKLETFLELAPTIDFTPDFHFSFAGAFGIRVYLN